MSAPPGPRRGAVVFIFITLVLDVLAVGIIIPVLPGLVVGYAGGDAAHGAAIFGLFGTVWALAQFIAAPVLGALSDRVGRRPVILLSCLGLGLDYILMALAPNLAWLFIGRVLSGITAAGYPTAAAYIADVTPPERRAAGFGLLGAAIGLGLVLGPAVGGLLGGADPRLPFWVAAAFCLVNAAYGFFVLPESLPPERRSPFTWRRANPFHALGLLWTTRSQFWLSAVLLLGTLAHESLPNVFVLYAAYRYGWGPQEVGLTLAAVGICSAVVQLALVRPAVAHFGDRGTLIIGLAFGAIGFALYGLAASGLAFALAIPVMALWGLSSAPLQGLMSMQVGPGDQGRLQGASGSLRSTCGVLGPGLMTMVYAWFIADDHPHVPGAPYLLAALLVAASLPLAWVAKKRTSAPTSAA